MSGSNAPDEWGTSGTIGTPAPGNVPGARSGLRLVDGREREPLALRGEWVQCGGRFCDWFGFNDLWKCDPGIGQWTWMSGSNAVELGRYVRDDRDAGAGERPRGAERLRLVDGRKREALALRRRRLFGERLWLSERPLEVRRDGQWTWMSGSNAPDQYGTYGTLGTPAPGNVPGARSRSVSWTDASGKLWLFGGWGFSAGRIRPPERPLEIRPRDRAVDLDGRVGLVRPGGRVRDARDARAGEHPGGTASLPSRGRTETGSSGSSGVRTPSWERRPNDAMNDLWRFDPAIGQWAWMGGSNSPNQIGTYGTLGTPAPGNVAGAREGAVSGRTEAKSSGSSAGGASARRRSEERSTISGPTPSAPRSRLRLRGAPPDAAPEP